MREKRIQDKIFLNSLVLTVSIAILGGLISYGLDFVRMDEILRDIEENELDTLGYLLEREYLQINDMDGCEQIDERLVSLKKEIQEVGISLTRYSGDTIFSKKDFDYLKRKYFLLEFRFLSLVNDLNEKCGKDYVPVLFFYEIDHDDSITQGYVLDEFSLSEELKTRIAILSFDKDYKDEPIVELILRRYNISVAPTIIINNEERFEGLTYSGQVNATLKRILKIDQPDPWGSEQDFRFTLLANGRNVTEYISEIDKVLEGNISEFARGDLLLMKGRLLQDGETICSSLVHYDNAVSEDDEENALIYETIASIDCGRNQRAFLNLAAESWERSGNHFRAELDRTLAKGDEPKLRFSISDVPPLNRSTTNYTQALIGSTQIILGKDDLLLSQTDRVTRDWISYQLEGSPYATKILATFSERLAYNETDLRQDIGWHEGGRILKMTPYLHHLPASGTLVAYKNGRWYAPNEKGVFMFEVPLDKLLYPTTRFLQEDLAVVIDTHGINMMVEQAVRLNATAVIGCCDHPGKVKAVEYLSRKGIKSICLTDKYLPLLLDRNVAALGSPPIRVRQDKVVLGSRSAWINRDEKIVLMNITARRYAFSYYDTAKRYFEAFDRLMDVDLVYVDVDDFGQMDKVISKAEDINASTVAVRVFSKDDYDEVKSWLTRDSRRKAVLFHSVSYPYGYLLLKEMPEQTTFGDINPIFS